MSTAPDRSQRKALGKGLSALLPSRPAPVAHSEPVAVEAPAARPPLPENFEEFQTIPIDQISPSEDQPRTNFDGEKLHELAASIRVNGLIQPITVYRSGVDQFTLIAGERRWRAAQLAGLKEIPALVRSVDKHRLLELALVENIQREDLNAMEIAEAFQRLAEEHGLSHEQIAERTGKDRSTITNTLRLLRLTLPVRVALADGRISAGHARALLNVANDTEQIALCKRVIDQQLSVRATERLTKERGQQPKESNEKPIDPNVRAAIQELERSLGTRVRIFPRSDRAGKIEIEYYSPDDLDRIYSVIVKE